MLNSYELTKEEKKYGYNIKQEKSNIRLSDGKVLSGKLVRSKYKDTDIHRYILSYGSSDSGMLVMTQIDKSFAADEEVIINRFFDTLAISM